MNNVYLLILVVLLLGCSKRMHQDAMMDRTFQGVSFSTPEYFETFVPDHVNASNSVKEIEARSEEGGFSTLLLVEEEHTFNEPKLGIGVTVYDLPGQLLDDVKCNYSQISRDIATTKLDSFIPELGDENFKTNVERVSDEALMVNVIHSPGDKMRQRVHYLIVDAGKIVMFIFSEGAFTNNRNLSLISERVFQSISIEDRSICRELV